MTGGRRPRMTQMRMRADMCFTGATEEFLWLAKESGWKNLTVWRRRHLHCLANEWGTSYRGALAVVRRHWKK